MRAKIIRPEGYRCAPSGAVVETFQFGAEVTGVVAEWAIADGAAFEIQAAPPLETKAPKPRRTRSRAGA